MSRKIRHLDPVPDRVVEWRVHRRYLITVFMMTIGFTAVWALSDLSLGLGARPISASEHGLMVMTALYLVLILAVVVVQRRQRASDRVAGEALRRRVTPVEAWTVCDVVGRWHLGAAAVTYGGALVLVAAGFVSGRHWVHTQLFLTTSAVVIAFAGLTALHLYLVLTRPVVAADERGLTLDRMLRTSDARLALAPYPLIPAAIGLVSTSSGRVVPWLFAGYVAAVSVTWLVAIRRDSTAVHDGTLRS